MAVSVGDGSSEMESVGVFVGGDTVGVGVAKERVLETSSDRETEAVGLGVEVAVLALRDQVRPLAVLVGLGGVGDGLAVQL